MPDDRLLLDTLALVRERGPIGERSLADAVAHSDRFVACLPATAASLIDLGSGGGLPGLVIAWRRPDVRVTLVERRGSRSDLLERAVRRLGVEATTVVVSGDVADVASKGIMVDVVTARSFGPPSLVVRWADRLLAPGGTVLVSEPPDVPARWDPDLLSSAGLVDNGVHQGIRVLARPSASS